MLIAQIAGRQHGLVTRQQLLGLGLTRRAVDARTIFGTASRRTDAQLARAVNEARRNGYLPERQLRRLLDRCRRLQRLIEPDQALTRSELEDAFVRFIKRYRLPAPQLNVMFHGFEVDGLYAAEKLIIELTAGATTATRSHVSAIASGMRSAAATVMTLTASPVPG